MTSFLPLMKTVPGTLSKFSFGKFSWRKGSVGGFAANMEKEEPFFKRLLLPCYIYDYAWFSTVSNAVYAERGIGVRCIKMIPLCLALLEELDSHLLKQCIGQHILILLDILRRLLAKVIQLRLEQIGGTAGNGLGRRR